MRRTTSTLFLLAGLSACGSRSALLDGGATEGSAGSGGTTGTAGTGGTVGTGGTGAGVGSGGTGGLVGTGGTGGGATAACVLAQEVATLNDQSDDGPPSLIAQVVGSPTALVFTRSPASSQGAFIAAFDGWGPWPPPELAAGTTTSFAQVNGQPSLPMIGILAVSPPTPEVWGCDAAFVYDNPPSTFLDMEAFQAHGAAAPTLSGTPVLLEATGDADAAIAAVATSVAGNSALTLAVSKVGSGWSIFNAGCATKPPAADAAGSPSGWILAAALGTPLDLSNPTASQDATCPGAVGPAMGIQLATLDLYAKPGPVTQPLATTAPVSRLRVVPRSTGAWVFWSEEGQPGLMGAAVDGSAHVSSALFTTLAQASLVDAAFDVQPLGDAAVVAAVSGLVSGQQSVVVEAVSGPDQVQWSAMVPVGGQVDGPPRLLVSQGGGSILVAWSELPPGATTHRLRLARLNCM